MNGALVLQGNALALPLPDKSVDLVITSPPYFSLRSYRDEGTHYAGQIGSEPTPAEFLEALWAATAEMIRVLKPTGSIWVNLGDKYNSAASNQQASVPTSTLTGHPYGESGIARRGAVVQGIGQKSLMGLPWRYAIGCIDRLGLILRAEVIWSKPNGLPESVTDRVRRSHEQWFHLVKQGRYFSAVDEVREALAPTSVERMKYAVQNTHGARRSLYDRAKMGETSENIERESNPLGKLPGSVWTIPSEPLIIPAAVQAHYNLPDHFAAFPQEWPRRIILGWSSSGICVECGEGRRPMVERGLLDPDRPQTKRAMEIADAAGLTDEHKTAIRACGAGSNSNSPSVTATKRMTTLAMEAKAVLGSYWREFASSGNGTITGYACACGPDQDGEYWFGCGVHPWLSIDHEGNQCGAGAHVSDVAPPTRPAIVLDPFGGTGTVALVARALGRIAISIDLSHDYSRLAKWRIFQSGHAAKAESRMWAERQGTLLSEEL